MTPGTGPNDPNDPRSPRNTNYRPEFMTDKDDNVERLLAERVEARRKQQTRNFEKLARKSFILSKPQKPADPTEEDVVT